MQDDQHVYRLYNPDAQTVGIQCEVPALTLVCNIINAELASAIQHERFRIAASFPAAQEDCTAVVVYLRPPLSEEMWKKFTTFPQALRNMPKDRTRLTILKLWQTYLV